MWLLYIIISGVAWAALDALRKEVSDKVSVLAFVAWMTVGLVPTYGALYWWQGDYSAPSSSFWLPALVLIALNLTANAFIVMALERAPISILIPLLAVSPALTATGGMIILGEWLSPKQWIAIACILLASLGLSLSRPGPETSAADTKRFRQGVLLMIGVALLFSSATALDKVAMAHCSGLEFHLLFQNGAIALLSAIALIAKGRGHELRLSRRMSRMVAACVLAMIVGLGFQMKAIQIAEVGAVDAVKRGVGMLSAIVIGRTFFGEAFQRSTFVLAGLMLLGIILLGT